MNSGPNNSTVSLLKFWRICIVSQAEGDEDWIQDEDEDEGADCNVLRTETLRNVLRGSALPEALRSISVDEMLHRSFRRQGGQLLEYLNFTLFWRGMEALLWNCGAFTGGGLGISAQQTVESLRQFRNLVLDELCAEEGDLGGGALDGSVGYVKVRHLSDLYQSLRRKAQSGGSTIVASFWEARLEELPSDEMTVSGDEIAQALLSWLEELLEVSPEEGLESDLDVEEEEDYKDLCLPGLPAPTRRVLGSASSSASPYPGPCQVSSPGVMPSSPNTVGSGSSSGRQVGVLDWLTWPGSPRRDEELIEVARFRSQLVEHLQAGRIPSTSSSASVSSPSPPSDVTFIQFYRAVRDVVSEERQGGTTPRSSSKNAAAIRDAMIKAGLRRLETAVARQVLRNSFTDLQRLIRPKERPKKSESTQTSGIVAHLIRGQVVAAQVMEKRLGLYRIGFILGRARLTCLRDAFQSLVDSQMSLGPGGPPPRRPLGSPGLSPIANEDQPASPISPALSTGSRRRWQQKQQQQQGSSSNASYPRTE
eukprot:TRINITY_DN6680_c1_g1_i1.p1 TRINITY_DN6680_c1_g1~~TRINITY_DN6680_c1_g1_i1.p1  ORF type:complete len:535 (+),score=92.26 TRINITY_DN6680_c1_g1_i1:89-1693(+)